MFRFRIPIDKEVHAAVAVGMLAAMTGISFAIDAMGAHGEESGASSLQLQMGVTLSAAPAETDRAATSPAQRGSGPAGLVQLASLALAAQPAIQFADARFRADSERLEQARGARRANVSGTLGYRREFADSGGTTPFRSASGGLLLSIPVYRAQVDAGIGQAQSQEDSSRSAVEEARQNILFGVLDAYLSAAQADEESSLLEEERNVLLGQRRINERRMEGGVGTRVEVMETSARTEAILASMEATRSLYRSQLAELQRLSSFKVDRVARVQNRLPPLIVPMNVADAVAVAREKSSVLARLGAALAAAKAGVEVQRAALTPTVDLVGNLDRSRFAFDGGTTLLPSAALGLQVAIPLYTGGIASARIREAQAFAEGAQAQLEDAIRSLETELGKAYLDLQRATEQWRIQVNVLATANAALEATRKAFDAGARSNIDLLNSQQLTFSTRREVLRARVGVLVAQVRILSLSSSLNLQALAHLETAFDVPAYNASAAPRSTP